MELGGVTGELSLQPASRQQANKQPLQASTPVLLMRFLPLEQSEGTILPARIIPRLQTAAEGSFPERPDESS